MSVRESVGVVRVPEGHRITTFHALPEPRLVETDGGVLLAHLGLGGDDAADELDELVRQVAVAIDASRQASLCFSPQVGIVPGAPIASLGGRRPTTRRSSPMR